MWYGQSQIRNWPSVKRDFHFVQTFHLIYFICSLEYITTLYLRRLFYISAFIYLFNFCHSKWHTGITSGSAEITPGKLWGLYEMWD